MSNKYKYVKSNSGCIAVLVPLLHSNLSYIMNRFSNVLFKRFLLHMPRHLMTND